MEDTQGTSSYTVKHGSFEGPLDALLALIEKRKFQINDIALAQVADGYIEYVRSLSDFPLADSAQFVLVAATLVLIKSKSLLPTLSLTEEEEHSVEDLQDRLRMHQKFKERACEVGNMFGRHILFSARARKHSQTVFAPDKRMTVGFMKEVINTVLAQIPKVEALPQTVVKKVMSLEEAIVSLTDRITRNLSMSFREMSGMSAPTQAEKVSVIVTFLAMLELVKQGVITVTQEAMFEEINMHTQSVRVPRY